MYVFVHVCIFSCVLLWGVCRPISVKIRPWVFPKGHVPFSFWQGVTPMELDWLLTKSQDLISTFPGPVVTSFATTSSFFMWALGIELSSSCLQCGCHANGTIPTPVLCGPSYYMLALFNINSDHIKRNFWRSFFRFKAKLVAGNLWYWLQNGNCR